MKILKKIISSVCALSMIASFAVIASADGVPTVTAEIGTYDSKTGKGTVVISLEGVAPTMEINGTEGYGYIDGFETMLSFSSNDFDKSLYTSANRANNIIAGNISETGTASCKAYSSTKKGLVVSYTTSADPTSFTTAANFETKAPILTVNFQVVADGDGKYVPGNMSVAAESSLVTVSYHEDDDVETMILKTINYDDDPTTSTTSTNYYEGINIVDKIEFTSTEPDTVAVPARPVGTVFEGFNGIDTDRSVAAMVDTTLTKAANKVTWKINVTPQAGKTYTGPTEKEVTFPNIDAGANMKVGLIVSYADADIANVEITGIEY